MAYRFLTEYNSPNYTPAAQVAKVFGIARTISGVTDHWWGIWSGQTFEGIVSWLCRPGGNTSAHEVIDVDRVACIVGFMDAAWHSGNAIGNATTIGREHNPNPAVRQAVMNTSAENLADLRDPNAFGDVLLYGHNFWIGTECPGDFDLNEIDKLSYTKQPGNNFGDVRDKIVTPPPAPVEAEWVRNISDIVDVKLQVLSAAGAQVYDLNTIQPIPNSTIPRGTWVDIAKATKIGNQKFYISSYAANNLKANGILVTDLGIPAEPPTQEKPEWLKNIVDIDDKDMWTRSVTPVLNLADGKTVTNLVINTKVRVIKYTTVVGNKLLVLDGETTCIEPIYLSDTPISNPDSDLEKENNTLLKSLLALLQSLITKFNSIFK